MDCILFSLSEITGVKQIQPTIHSQLPEPGNVSGWVAQQVGVTSSWGETDHSAGPSTHAYHAPVTSSADNIGLTSTNLWMDQSYAHRPVARSDSHNDSVTPQVFIPNGEIYYNLSLSDIGCYLFIMKSC